MPGFQIQFEAIDEASPTIQKLSQMMMDAAQKSDRFAAEMMNSSNRIDTSLKKVSSSAKPAKDSIDALSQAGSQLQQALLGFATVAGIAAFFKSSAEAAMAEEEALRRLSFAVDATGGSFDQSRERILAFGREQQQVTQFSDDQTYEVMGRLVRVTGDVGQAMQATRLVFGLASASGKDFNTVLDLLGPILQGDSTRLRGLKNEFGSFIGNATTAQEVVDNLSKRFLGAAESQSGYQRELSSLRNRLDDFKETVGAGVLPAFKLFLEGVLKGAEFFEILGVVISNFAARAVNRLQGLGEVIGAIFTGNISKVPEISEQMLQRAVAIEEASAAQATEVERKYSKERAEIVQEEGRIKTGVTQKSVEEARKEAEEKTKAAQDAHDMITRMNAEALELEGEALDSKLEMIDLEKEQRSRQLDELRAKEILTAEEVNNAKITAMEIAALKSAEARTKSLEDLQAMEDGAKRVAESFASSMGSAFADVILEGKNMQDAFDAVFKTVLRTAIETFTRIAIESAILRGSTGGLGTFGGILAVGAMAAPMFKGFKLQEGGIVRRATIAQVGESGPEAVIPLDRLGQFTGGGSGEISINITQNNTISVQGIGDDQVRTLMKRISEATRSGAAEGAELVKSILSKQDRFARESV